MEDTPPFPSLYLPIRPLSDEQRYLVYTADIWRFTLYWTLILFGGAHLFVACYAVVTQRRSWRVIWVVPLVYIAIAGLEGLLVGSVEGLM